MQRFSRRGLVIIIVLSVALAAVSLATLIPQSRRTLRQWVLGQGREILAKTSGYVFPDGPFVTVLKIREKETLFLEIYKNQGQDESPLLMQRIPLEEGRDGYFSFMGNATNLALSDTNSDGAMDILAPTFDSQMTARLNVFVFNRAVERFERAIPPPPEM